MSLPRFRRLAALCLLAPGFWLLHTAICLAAAGDDLPLREESAIKAAVDRVAPSVVRIETLGGLETVDSVLIGGATSGVIVSTEGHIVSSAFNFVRKPSQIFVYLADGTRLPAQLVARDHSRMIVLLKVPTETLDIARHLPLPEAAPVGEMRVGQWTIAVGRVFEGAKPNVSVGIVSALNRVWGKAIQTDAKISPSNYGGALVDIRGRVLGVLVPMSPQESGEMAGVEWYDSGIGFAVPLEHIYRVLDRLKRADLHPGLVGISMRSADAYSDEPILAAVHPRSPAADAGLRAGDKIVELGGVKVATQTQLRRQIAPYYAGDKVTLVALRDDKRIERSIELAEKLLPYVHPFLGILPRRDPDTKGVVVRDVYADSPAAKAGIKPGDRITSIDGEKVADRVALQERLATLEPMQSLKIEIERDGKQQTIEAKLGTLPEAVPDSLPPARDSKQPAADAVSSTGKIKVPELPNEALIFVPKTYHADVPHGVVLWLHPAGGFKDDDKPPSDGMMPLRGAAVAQTGIVTRWQPLCEAHDLILLAPRSLEAGAWPRSDIEFVRKALDEVVQKYKVDRTRIVVVGEDAGGAMAYLFTSGARDLVRGVAAIGAPLPPAMKTMATDPANRLAFFTTTMEKTAPAVAAGIKRLREAKHPVTELKLGPDARPLSADELAQLARWIDTLDRS